MNQHVNCKSDTEINPIYSCVIAYLILNYDTKLENKLIFCHFCFSKLNSNKLPFRCILDGMVLYLHPKEISVLNLFEKLLSKP